MSDLSPLLGEERKSSFGAVRSVDDPGCVKTCTSRECAELFSLFSSFNGDCQSGSFLNQRNRDKLSTRKFDVGVFTQPGPRADYPNAVLARYHRAAALDTHRTGCSSPHPADGDTRCAVM